MRSTAKYFWLVAALFVLQVLLGIVTAHYAVEGQGLYGLPFAEYFPYAVTRTWHTQLAVLWIATAWLAAGLYLAPLLSGHEPKYQRFGVNFLFYSLLVIVVGSFAGQWSAVHRFISDMKVNFWFGHQGYEYVDLGLATVMILLATIIFLGGGVLGTFHHLYWSGTPISVMALGATFSALEVVPLMVIGFEAYNHAKIEHDTGWQTAYHWPFMFFSAVLFWNLVGAGLFGFLINTPIALYYMQGLNTTANHGHAALFGVYGMLGIGLMLYCMRGLTDVTRWNQQLLKISFWSLNAGLAMMTFLSLLPQGLWQTYASMKYFYAYARSAEFMHSAVMEGFVWARVPGDIVFSVGVFAFAAFVIQAFWSRQQKPGILVKPVPA